MTSAAASTRLPRRSTTTSAAASTTAGPRCAESFIDLGAIGCYHIHESSMNFADALLYCQSLNADLATPSSLDPLRQYLLDNGKTGEYWVGLVRPSGWIDGRRDDPSEWDEGEPNDSGACARLRDSSDFKAADHGCLNSYKVICEQEV
nr:lithostathine-1-beta-like [Penaeus vannamei]